MLDQTYWDERKASLTSWTQNGSAMSDKQKACILRNLKSPWITSDRITDEDKETIRLAVLGNSITKNTASIIIESLLNILAPHSTDAENEVFETAKKEIKMCVQRINQPYGQKNPTI